MTKKKSPDPSEAPKSAPVRRKTKRAETDEPTERDAKDAFVEALTEALGVVAYACKRTGVPRERFDEWVQKDPEFAKRVRSIDELALDFVEGKAYEEIKNGNARLIQFYLETKGRARGFGKEDGAEKKQVVVLLTQEEMDY